MSFGREHYQDAVRLIRSRSALRPEVGLILGSGLREVANEVMAPVSIPYGDIPHFPRSTVAGHDGRLVIGHLEGRPVVVMQGRAHFYEGYTMAQVTLPVRVLSLLGVRSLILTNAAGGLRDEFRVGDLMLITDHINLPGMVGHNPLHGPNDEQFGTRFPDLTVAYDPELRRIARTTADREGIPLHEGVYVMLSGPAFETPAELRMLRVLGADAVGMSTVPETVAARHAGMRVLGISGITNKVRFQAAEGSPPTHDEVLAAAEIIAPRLLRLVRGVLREVPPPEHTP